MKREKNDYKIGELLKMFEQQKTIKKGLTKLRIMEFWEAEMGHAINTATKKSLSPETKSSLKLPQRVSAKNYPFLKNFYLPALTNWPVVMRLKRW